jgi:hypothetical protein
VAILALDVLLKVMLLETFLFVLSDLTSAPFAIRALLYMWGQLRPPELEF